MSLDSLSPVSDRIQPRAQRLFNFYFTHHRHFDTALQLIYTLVAHAQRMTVAVARSPNMRMRAAHVGAAARPKGLALLTASSFLRYDQTIDLHLLSVQVLKQRVGAYIRILIRDVGLPPQCASTVSRGR